MSAAGGAVQLTDPRELLEVFTEAGEPTGTALPRGQIHLEGHWHQAFFCWIARPGREGPEILLQHRAARKDVWPLRFDASAAGHIRFGESMAEAAREVREELGIAVELRDMLHLGRHRQQHDHANGLIDREYHVVHLLMPGPPDAAYQPDPREVAGLAWLGLDDLLGLVEGRIGEAQARYRAAAAGPDAFVARTLTLTDLVPYADGYHRWLLGAIREEMGRRGL
ncbi:MAG: NUDIX domain-containing protein [Chloroflexi bacterium]|nr:NUDIX domain-containing protein [Chloroflexota bacterium]